MINFGNPYDEVKAGQYWINSFTNEIVYIMKKDKTIDDHWYVELYGYRYDKEDYDLRSFLTRFTPYMRKSVK